jgi:hypothetical protein
VVRGLRAEVADTPSRRHWLAPLGFAGAFCLLGLLTLDAFGASWDEPLHRGWGEANWAYLRTGDPALVTGLPGGGDHYGPFFYLLGYGVSRLLHNVAGLDFTPANHVLTLITASIGVACTFLLAERLFNRRVAIAATTLLILTPPFLAHAHYNPKDIPLLTLVTATLLFATMAYRSRRAVHAAIAGALLGLAIAMKATAFIAVPILIAALSVDLLPSRRPALRASIRLTVIAAVAAVVTLFLGWPILWRQPARLLESIAYFARGSFWSGNVLYFGEMTPATALPWHYAPVMLILALPMSMVLLSVIGAVSSAEHARAPENRFRAALPILWAILPVMLFLKPGLARYDGMRQLFFMVPAVAILAGAGWDTIWSRLRARRWRRSFMLLSALLVSWLAIDGARAFPYGGSWVNAPARAVLGPHLERRFEIEYWGVSYREGLRWLQRSAEADARVCTPVATHLVAWQPDVIRPDLGYGCDGEPDYIMLMTRFSEWPDRYLDFRDTSPVLAVSRFGSDLLYIYRAR